MEPDAEGDAVNGRPEPKLWLAVDIPPVIELVTVTPWFVEFVDIFCDIDETVDDANEAFTEVTVDDAGVEFTDVTTGFDLVDVVVDLEDVDVELGPGNWLSSAVYERFLPLLD